jgi:hypothetical protein
VAVVAAAAGVDGGGGGRRGAGSEAHGQGDPPAHRAQSVRSQPLKFFSKHRNVMRCGQQMIRIDCVILIPEGFKGA